MDNTWIKLYRKIVDNDLMADATALQIFVWLLVNVDRKTGKTTIGRFSTSKELGLKPITFYKALKRLETKYKIVSLVTKKVTIKYTEVSLLNWSKYQNSNHINNIDDNNSVTIQEQSDNNSITLLQEVKNKEDKNINTKTSKNSLTPCTEKELWEIANSLSVSMRDVQITHASILDQIEAKEFKHKTVYHTCRNWVRMGIQRGNIKNVYKTEKAVVPQTIQIPEQTPEEREAALAKAEEIRQQLYTRFRAKV